jgi:hypothetical protein
MMPPEAGLRQSLHDLPRRKAISFRMNVIRRPMQHSP